MAVSYNPRLLMVKSNRELGLLYHATKIGMDTGYNVEDIRKEIAFRELVEEWSTEPEPKDDGGCGHDQNEDYYRD